MDKGDWRYRWNGGCSGVGEGRRCDEKYQKWALYFLLSLGVNALIFDVVNGHVTLFRLGDREEDIGLKTEASDSVKPYSIKYIDTSYRGYHRFS